MKWFTQNINLLIPSMGLIFDIIGALLVAWEVVKQYKGERFISPQTTMADMTETSKLPEATEHPQYKIFEINKYRKMKCGLFSDHWLYSSNDSIYPANIQSSYFNKGDRPLILLFSMLSGGFGLYGITAIAFKSEFR